MTRHPLNPLMAFGLALASVVSWHVAVGAAQTLGDPEHFVASYVDLNTGRTGPVEMDVRRWSTEAERAALMDTLFKQGSHALLDKLRDMRPVGRIYTPGSIGYELRYAQQQSCPMAVAKLFLPPISR